MTPFKLLNNLAGLSNREASNFFSVHRDTVKAWSSGKNTAPAEVLEELRGLIEKIDRAAGQIVDFINRSGAIDVELGYYVDDHKAQSLGLPGVGAHNAILARVIAELPDDIKINLVPRGSTPGTAAAADQHL